MLTGVLGLALVLSDERQRGLWLSTLWLVGPVTLISLAAGVSLAMLLYRTDIPCRGALRAVLGVLLLLPLYVQAAAWQAAFGVQGWLTPEGLPALVDSLRGAIIVHAAAATPWVVLIVGLGLELAEPELEEDALLDAAGPRVFWRVTLRRSLAWVLAAGIWIAITTAGEMTVTNLFQVRTLSEEVYTEFTLGGTSTEAVTGLLPAALASVWLVLGALLLVAHLAPRHGQATARGSRRLAIGRWRWPLGFLAVAAVALVCGVPLASLVYKAGVLITPTEVGWTRSWSPAKAASVVTLSPGRFSREFGWSLLIGSLAATAAVAIATPLAWLARRRGWRALPLMLAVALGMAMPGPLVGIGLVGLMNQPDAPWLIALYDNTIAAPWAAQTFRCLPLAGLILWHALASIPRELVESAASEGAGPATTLFRIALPERTAALASAWLVALCIALGELAASILVVPPRVTLLSIQVFGLIHYGVDDYVAGICIVLVAIVAAMAVASRVLARRTFGSVGDKPK